MITYESLGHYAAQRLYWIRSAVIDATFLWHKENDPKGEKPCPYDILLDELPGPNAKIEDATGYVRRTGFRTKGFVPSSGIPYFWLGRDAHFLLDAD